MTRVEPAGARDFGGSYGGDVLKFIGGDVLAVFRLKPAIGGTRLQRVGPVGSATGGDGYCHPDRGAPVCVRDKLADGDLCVRGLPFMRTKCSSEIAHRQEGSNSPDLQLTKLSGSRHFSDPLAATLS